MLQSTARNVFYHDLHNQQHITASSIKQEQRKYFIRPTFNFVIRKIRALRIIGMMKTAVYLPLLKTLERRKRKRQNGNNVQNRQWFL